MWFSSTSSLCFSSNTNNNNNSNNNSNVDKNSKVIKLVAQDQLPILDLQGSNDNRLTSLSGLGIGEMPWLVELDVSKNSLKDFNGISDDDDAGALRNLEVLYLNQNCFEAVPSQIRHLTALRELHIRVNQVKNWPAFLGKLENLEVLDLAFNKLSQMSFSSTSNKKISLGSNTLAPPRARPPGLKKHKKRPIYTSLKKLDISYNSFTSFPRCALKFSSLEYFNISSNSVKRLPIEISRLQNTLTTLCINECELTDFPEAVFMLTKLKHLEISNNQFGYFPQAPNFAARLPNLTYLDVSKCGLTSIEFLKGFSSLKVIVAANNKIQTLGPELATLTALEEFHLAKNEIMCIPSLIGELRNLRLLNLSDNTIKLLSEDIGKCTDLRTLQLQNNFIKGELPSQMSQLTKLTHLDVSNNRLSKLCDVSGMKSLEILKANNNTLVSVPDGIGKLKSLRKLHLHCNVIPELPNDFYDLVGLEELNLRRNHLSAISPAMATNMTALKSLNLNNNEIQELHLELFAKHNTSLQQLSVNQNNPNVVDLPETVSQWVQRQGIQIENEFETPDLIMPGLFLGSATSATNKLLLKSLGITHILTVAKDIPPPHPDHFTYKVVAEEDLKRTDLKQHFEDCIKFIDAGRSKGACLVHCLQGISRSSTIVIAYVMTEKNMSARMAFNFVVNKRPIVHPNESFQAQLYEYEKELIKKRKSCMKISTTTAAAASGSSNRGSSGTTGTMGTTTTTTGAATSAASNSRTLAGSSSASFSGTPGTATATNNNGSTSSSNGGGTRRTSLGASNSNIGMLPITAGFVVVQQQVLQPTPPSSPTEQRRPLEHIRHHAAVFAHPTAHKRSIKRL